MPNESVQRLLDPLFANLPLEQAMPDLIVTGRASKSVVDLVDRLTAEVVDREVQAGLWLYADCLDKAHVLVQDASTATGMYWHGIIHRREGDFWNSKYWFKRARNVDLGLSLQSGQFVDRVEHAGDDKPNLLAVQRQEWLALLSICIDGSVDRE